MPVPPGPALVTAADVAQSVLAVREAHSILGVFHELILAEPDIGDGNAHGRADVAITLAAATGLAKRKASTRPAKSSAAAANSQRKRKRKDELALRKPRLGGRRRHKKA